MKRREAIAVAGLCLSASCLRPGLGASQTAGATPSPVTVVFDAPAAGATMVDLMALGFHLAGPPRAVAAVSRVELRFSGLPIDEVVTSYPALAQSGDAVVTTPPESLTTSANGLLFDGDYGAQWIAKDGRGLEVARSERRKIGVRRLTPANMPGVTWTYAVDPAVPPDGATVSGPLRVAISAGWAGPGIKPGAHEILQFYVDGELARPLAWTQQGVPAGWTIDTTAFRNGVHQVYVQAELEGASPDVLYYALRRELDFENGRAPQALIPEFADVNLHPGESLPLRFKQTYTDGSSTFVDPATLTVANTDTVNPAIVLATGATDPARYAGSLRALPGAAGATSLVFTSAALHQSTPVRVYVEPDLHVPHVSRTGRALMAYDPGQSVFVRTLFSSGTRPPVRPDQAAQYHAAGINALSMGFYANPADSHVTAPGAETLAQWSNWPNPGSPPWTYSFDHFIDPSYEWARANGFLLFLTGDDMARTAAERLDTATNPWAHAAIEYALRKAVNTGIAASLDMVDETDMVLGGAPTPPIATLVAAINKVPQRPSVGWPLLGAASGASVASWNGDPSLSDHLTYYWTSWDRRPAYLYGSSIGEVARYMLTQPKVGFYARRPYVQRTLAQPFFMLTGNGTTGQYETWTGHILALAQAETAEVMIAAAIGAAGVRCFQLDIDGNKKERAKAIAARLAGNNPWAVTSGVFADPWTVGGDRWASIGAAFNLTERLTPYLFGERANALALAGNFVVGARRSADSRLYLAVNVSEAPSPQEVNLSAYLASSVRSITRYRLKGDGLLVTETLPVSTTVDSVTFEGAETIAWLIQ